MTTLGYEGFVNHTHHPTSRAIFRKEVEPDGTGAFAFIRNPWTRIGSWFTHSRKPSTVNVETFAAFRHSTKGKRMLEGGPYTYRSMLCDADGVLLPGIRIFRFEELPGIINDVAKYLELPFPVEHNKINSSGSPKNLWTPKNLELYECLWRDAELFDYEPPSS